MTSIKLIALKYGSLLTL